MKTSLFVVLAIFRSISASEIEKGRDLLERPDTTESLVQELIRDVNALKSQDRLLLNKVASLEKQLRIQRQRNLNLERIVNKLTFSDKEQVFYQEGKPLSPRKTESSNEKVALIDRIRRQDAKSPIAFFAKMTPNLEHAGVHQTIIFDVVVTNLGNAYNNRLGVFITPVSGTYVFSTTLVSVFLKGAHAQFTVNGNAITTMYVSSGDNHTGNDSTSQTIVLQLQKGDLVSVQNLDSDKGFAGGSHSIFSGFLLLEYAPPSDFVGK